MRKPWLIQLTVLALWEIKQINKIYSFIFKIIQKEVIFKRYDYTE